MAVATKNFLDDSGQPFLIDGIQAARRLSISPKFLARLAAAGEVPSVKLRRRRLYNPRVLASWAAQQAMSSNSGTPHRGV